MKNVKLLLLKSSKLYPKIHRSKQPNYFIVHHYVKGNIESNTYDLFSHFDHALEYLIEHSNKCECRDFHKCIMQLSLDVLEKQLAKEGFVDYVCKSWTSKVDKRYFRIISQIPINAI